MNEPFAYTVRCAFDDRAVADEWIAWLRGGHLADVCAAGALSAEVVRLDADAAVAVGACLSRPSGASGCEVHYRFASRASFDAYVRDHAPRLRAEGLARFPPERGVRYERSSGSVVAQFPPAAT